VSRGGDERGEQNRADQTPRAAQDKSVESRPERTERERVANRRLERAEDMRGAKRLARPTAPEMQMMSVFATLGERYQEDYFREHKLKEEDGWYVTHVDFAWPAERLVIEVYGGPHYKPALDKAGTRQEKDARREANVKRAGWALMVIKDTELTQDRWAGTLERVRKFLDTGRR